MRPLLYACSALVVMALAFWAYRENYTTQHALRELNRVQNTIASLREDIAMQKAEWEYENRPSRLQALAVANFDRLKLLPMAPWQLSEATLVPYRVPQGGQVVAADGTADNKLALAGVQNLTGSVNPVTAGAAEAGARP